MRSVAIQRKTEECVRAARERSSCATYIQFYLKKNFCAPLWSIFSRFANYLLSVAPFISFLSFSLFLLYSLSLLFSFNLCFTFSLSALFTGVHFIVFTLYVFSSLCLVGLLSRSILIVCFTFTFLFCFAYSVFAHSIVRFLITTNKALCSFQQMFACRYVRACATRTVGLIWC